MKSIPALLLGAWLVLALGHARAEGLRVMTWNIEGGAVSAGVIAERVEQALATVGPVDVLVLQEIVSQDQVQAAAAGGGFAHWAMSDFAPPVAVTGAWHQSLEVAVLSRLPIETAAEWDTTGRKRRGDGHAPRLSARDGPGHELRMDAVAGEPPPARGFLRADLANGWSVYAVHWKSSRSQDCTAEDRAHARLREVQATGLAADAGRMLTRGRTVMVAGDYNIQAPGRALRVGTDPHEDCAPTGGRCAAYCGPAKRDGYDDSIALLLRIDPGARLLSGGLDSTYLPRRFPGGAIDHILVAGPRAAGFEPAETPPAHGKRWHGADHRPVVTEITEAR
jgi:endonuclease/exonuclease/phosphatase family metal-dependent hydrolase